MALMVWDHVLLGSFCASCTRIGCLAGPCLHLIRQMCVLVPQLFLHTLLPYVLSIYVRVFPVNSSPMAFGLWYLLLGGVSKRASG